MVQIVSKKKCRILFQIEKRIEYELIFLYFRFMFKKSDLDQLSGSRNYFYYIRIRLWVDLTFMFKSYKLGPRMKASFHYPGSKYHWHTYKYWICYTKNKIESCKFAECKCVEKVAKLFSCNPFYFYIISSFLTFLQISIL